MKIVLSLFSFVSFMILASLVGHAKEWRGIVPLHSTRQDVTRLFGVSPDANNIRANYSFEKENVYIVFSGDEFCAGRLPKDTVLLIEVTPKTKLQLADLQMDKAVLRKFEPSSPPGIGFEGYIDDANGVVVRTFKGRVDEIAYVADSQDRKLCSEYYGNLEGFLTLIVEFFPRKVDEYGDIPSADEKARLDVFATVLHNKPESLGYIIVYSGRNVGPAAAKARATRARNYLAAKRNIKHITIIVGGRREEFSLELYTQGRDLPGPTPIRKRYQMRVAQ